MKPITAEWAAKMNVSQDLEKTLYLAVFKELCK